jgi:hypothetical protein
MFPGAPPPACATASSTTTSTSTSTSCGRRSVCPPTSRDLGCAAGLRHSRWLDERYSGVDGTAQGSVDPLPVRPRPRWKEQHPAQAVPEGVPASRVASSRSPAPPCRTPPPSRRCFSPPRRSSPTSRRSTPLRPATCPAAWAAWTSEGLLRQVGRVVLVHRSPFTIARPRFGRARPSPGGPSGTLMRPPSGVVGSGRTVGNQVERRPVPVSLLRTL